MISRTLLILALSFALPMSSSAQGIDFVKDSTLKQLLALSKEQNKPIFIDCYTTWCGPCKWMNKNVFPSESVGAFYNEKFVCAKIDMEKGDGVRIAKRYDVVVYPTFLFIGMDGKMLHKGAGGIKDSAFIALGTDALDSKKQYGPMLEAYKNGQRDDAFIKKYISTARMVYDKSARESFDWFLHGFEATDYQKAENFEFIANCADWLRPEQMRIIPFNDPVLKNAVGEEAIADVIKKYFDGQFRKTYEFVVTEEETGNGQYLPNKEKHKALMDEVTAMNFTGKEAYINERLLYYHVDYGNIDEIMQYYPKVQDINAGYMNSIAWDFYEGTDDKKKLTWALELIKESLSLEESWEAHDTHAAICFKLKLKDEGIAAAEKAISMAAESDYDAAETKKLLEDLKKL